MNFELPDIAFYRPLIRPLFEKDRIDGFISTYQESVKHNKIPSMEKQLQKSLDILQDWKKVLQQEMTLEQYNELHQLSDLK